jgi:hypothetical protein
MGVSARWSTNQRFVRDADDNVSVAFDNQRDKHNCDRHGNSRPPKYYRNRIRPTLGHTAVCLYMPVEYK